MLLIVRAMLRAGQPRGLVLPAVLGSMRRSRGAAIVHAPPVLFLLGLPFFFLALADPFTALVSREMSFPGRRIGIMIDASISMRTPFTAATLNKRAATDATFFTTVAAAERFVQLRMKGKYRDLIGLIEFGNQVRNHAVHQRLRQCCEHRSSATPWVQPVPGSGTVIMRAVTQTVRLKGVQLRRRLRQPDGAVQ